MGVDEEGVRPAQRRRFPRADKVIVLVALLGFGGAAWWRWNDAQHRLARPTIVPAAAAAQRSFAPAGIVIGGGPWRVGQCVTWDQAGGADPHRQGRAVPCDQTHLIEVTGSTDLRARFVSYPTDAEFETLRTTLCQDLAERYLGVALDPHGRFAVAELTPDPLDWRARGVAARTLWCGIGAARHVVAAGTPVLAYPPISGEARGASQKFLYGTGTCLTTTPAGAIDAIVACTGYHSLEVSGTVDLTGKTPTNPTGSANNGLLTQLCGPVAQTYLKRPLRVGEGTGFINISPEGWAAGDRLVECTVGRYQGDFPIPFNGPLASAA